MDPIEADAGAASEVLYTLDGAVAVITLNAPQRMNTISGPMLEQLTRALVKANEDRAVRVVILTGNGRAFCAGLNLAAQSEGSDNLSVGSGATPTNIDLRNTPPTVLQAMDKPTICAVQGRCIAGALIYVQKARISPDAAFSVTDGWLRSRSISGENSASAAGSSMPRSCRYAISEVANPPPPESPATIRCSASTPRPRSP